MADDKKLKSIAASTARRQVLNGLRDVRFWLERSYELTDEQRAILHEIVTMALEGEVAQPGELTDWPVAMRQMEGLHRALVTIKDADPSTMNLLARVTAQIGQYERGSRNAGLRWQVMASLRDGADLVRKSKGG